ncbi:ABC transporter permease [soil metagenome]
MVAATIRAAVPYVLAAQGGVLAERSGIVNVGLEGMMLSGAFASIAATLASGSIAVGLLTAAAVGGVVGLIHVLVIERLRVDGIVSGLAINLAAAGGTRVLLRALYGSSSNSPPLPADPAETHVAGVRWIFHALTAPTTVLAVVASFGLAWVLTRTRFGLRVRAAGESGRGLAAAGVSFFRTRALATTVSGMLAALGGAALALEQRQFQSGMTGGRGFIALAAVVLATWRPLPALVACAGFAVLDACAVVLQGEARSLEALFQALPYLATLVALALLARRARGSGAPRALGVEEET